MRMLVGTVLATALLGSTSIAYAADATAKIKSLDMTKDMVTLDNGSSYMAPKSVKLSDFKVGEKVTGELHQGRQQDGRHIDQACDLTAALSIGVFAHEPPV
jgi:hypothetical protein